MTSINNSQPINTSFNTVSSSTYVAPQTTTQQPVNYSSNDGYSANSLLSAKAPTAPEDTANKKAGAFKSFFAKISNTFGKVADSVGLGTISHFAKQNFTAYDTNKSNSVDANEFSAVSQMIGKSFQQVDANSNQEISLGEFKKIVGDLVDSEFKKLDTNGDAFLNMNEAAPYVVTNGANNSFTAHDTNGDQLLSRNEFAGLLNDMKIKKNN